MPDLPVPRRRDRYSTLTKVQDSSDIDEDFNNRRERERQLDGRRSVLLPDDEERGACGGGSDVDGKPGVELRPVEASTPATLAASPNSNSTSEASSGGDKGEAGRDQASGGRGNDKGKTGRDSKENRKKEASLPLVRAVEEPNSAPSATSEESDRTDSPVDPTK